MYSKFWPPRQRPGRSRRRDWLALRSGRRSSLRPSRRPDLDRFSRVIRSRRFWFWVVIVTLIGAGLRINKLGDAGLWVDEVNTVRSCSHLSNTHLSKILGYVPTALALWSFGVPLSEVSGDNVYLWKSLGVTQVRCDWQHVSWAFSLSRSSALQAVKFWELAQHLFWGSFLRWLRGTCGCRSAHAITLNNSCSRAFASSGTSTLRRVLLAGAWLPRWCPWC